MLFVRAPVHGTPFLLFASPSYSFIVAPSKISVFFATTDFSPFPVFLFSLSMRCHSLLLLWPPQCCSHGTMSFMRARFSMELHFYCYLLLRILMPLSPLKPLSFFRKKKSLHRVCCAAQLNPPTLVLMAIYSLAYVCILFILTEHFIYYANIIMHWLFYFVMRPHISTLFLFSFPHPCAIVHCHLWERICPRNSVSTVYLLFASLCIDRCS